MAGGLRIATKTLWDVFKGRITRGPKRPSWSWLHELLIEYIRNQNLLNPPPSLEKERKDFDSLESLEKNRKRALRQPVDIDGLPGCWVTPKDGPTRGILLYLHGGGYVIGSTRSHATLLAELAVATRSRVLAIDYRLAPEHPCPAAIEDSLKAYRWLLDEGFASEDIIIGGDSAGGGLTLATQLAASAAGLPNAAALLLLSPWVDLTLQTPSAQSTPLYDQLSPHALKKWAGEYAGSLSKEDPRVSPLFADLHGLPPTMIATGEVEMLVDETHLLAQRATAAGVDVTVDIVPDEIHDFLFFAIKNPRAEACLKRIDSFFKTHLAKHHLTPKG